MAARLKCVECRRVYPIRDDIPVMLVDEATIEDEPKNRTNRASLILLNSPFE